MFSRDKTVRGVENDDAVERLCFILADKKGVKERLNYPTLSLNRFAADL